MLAIVLFSVGLSACGTSRQAMREPEQRWDATVLGRPAEVVVKETILASDPDLKNKDLSDPTYLTAEDGHGGGYVIMSSAFGDKLSQGPRYTWGYHVRGAKLERLFRYPFEATEIAGKGPVVKGYYWAYDCVSAACENPDEGYLKKIPVKLMPAGRQWRIVVDASKKDRALLARESSLIVSYSRLKYGENNPQALRMEHQLSRLFGQKQWNAVQRTRLPSQLSQTPVTNSID